MVLSRRLLHRGGLVDRADLHEAHRLAEEVASGVLVQNLQGLGQGHQLCIARLHADLVLLVLSLAVLLQVHQEALVRLQRRSRGLTVLLGLRRLVQKVRKLRLLLVLLLRRRRDLRQLRRLQVLERDLRLHVLVLRLRQVPRELVLHLLQHAQDAAAARVERLRIRSRTLQVVRVRLHTNLLIGLLPRQQLCLRQRGPLAEGLLRDVLQGAHELEQVALHDVLELRVAQLDGVADLQERAACAARPRRKLRRGLLALLLQQVDLGQHLDRLFQQRNGLLVVLLGRQERRVLLLAVRGGRVERLRVLGDVGLQAADLRLELALTGRGLLDERRELLDRGLRVGDSLGLRLLIGLAPAHVLVVGLKVGLGVLLHLHLHLLDEGDHLADGAHVRGDRGLPRRRAAEEGGHAHGEDRQVGGGHLRGGARGASYNGEAWAGLEYMGRRLARLTPT
mmetsp:Transcript_33573/g.85912  ORF Transcript_33573/g.85912 Transcript_33573/m.85912 type:complete len:450 (-) Transcript_33573:4-1353(-)